MFRFRIKTLLYVTAVVAAWALLARGVNDGPTAVAFAGWTIYGCLIAWGIYRFFTSELKEQRTPQEREEEKRAE